MSTLQILPPLAKAFERMQDPRKAGGLRFPLVAMLSLAVAAMLRGAKGVTAISEWGRSRSAEERQNLGFKGDKMPCAATLFLLFEKLDTTLFEDCLREYFEPLQQIETAFAVDGKTIRGSQHDEFPGVHLISVFGHRTQIVFNQRWVSAKTNEITAIVPLLSELNIAGKMITADAMHTQHKLCDWVKDNGGHYYLTIKENQKQLYESAADCFSGFSPSR